MWSPKHKQSSTYVNVIATDEPQAKGELEEDSKADRDEPRQQPTTGHDLDAVVDEVAGQNHQQEVDDENYPEHDH